MQDRNRVEWKWASVSLSLIFIPVPLSLPKLQTARRVLHIEPITSMKLFSGRDKWEGILFSMPSHVEERHLCSHFVKTLANHVQLWKTSWIQQCQFNLGIVLINAFADAEGNKPCKSLTELSKLLSMSQWWEWRHCSWSWSLQSPLLSTVSF